MNVEGYLIVLKPDVNIRRYEACPRRREQLEEYKQEYEDFREAFGQFDPVKYRGVSRYPLEAFLTKDEKEFDRERRRGIDVDSNKDARIKLMDATPETVWEIGNFYDDDSLIDTFDNAVEIFRMLDDKASWEIVHIRRDSFSVNDNTLGFDLGYWGGGYFSLIADTIVTPRWHPPVPEDYCEVADSLSNLNENLLFDNPEDAIAFKQYYKSKEWSETEDVAGEFCVIQVDGVTVPFD